MQRNKFTLGTSQSPNKPARRRFIRQVTTGAAGFGLLSAWPERGNGNGFPNDDGNDFHFVHLTDQHVRRARKGDVGYRKCIERVNNLNPKPDFALMGGDGPFDGLYTEKSEFEDQIRLFQSISDDLEMPYYHCIGNHDVLGYSGSRKVPVTDPDLGKKFFMDLVGMDKSYYSFDFRGWHFVILDSIYPVEAEHGPSYVPRIGNEQLDWLRYDLATHSGKPTVAVTHIATFCNIGQIMGDPDMPSLHGRVLRDGRELREILERHKVKALLQEELEGIPVVE